MNEGPGARERGQQLMRALAVTFPAEAGVAEARMFNGIGLRVAEGFFAFVSRTGALVVKLPESTAAELIGSGLGEPKTMGRRTMREWVSLPQPIDGDTTQWRLLAEQARVLVQDVGHRSH